MMRCFCCTKSGKCTQSYKQGAAHCTFVRQSHIFHIPKKNHDCGLCYNYRCKYYHCSYNNYVCSDNITSAVIIITSSAIIYLRNEITSNYRGYGHHYRLGKKCCIYMPKLIQLSMSMSSSPILNIKLNNCDNTV